MRGKSEDSFGRWQAIKKIKNKKVERSLEEGRGGGPGLLPARFNVSRMFFGAKQEIRVSRKIRYVSVNGLVL